VAFVRTFISLSPTQFSNSPVASLDGLATAGNAPKIFTRTIRGGFPYVCVSFCACFSLLSFMSLASSSGQVFLWLSSLTATCGLWGWCAIGITYLRFRKGFLAQGMDRSKLPYTSMLQPYAAWWVVIGCVLCMIFSGYEVFLTGGWSTATFVTNYLPIVLFPILWVGCKFYKGTKFFIPPMEMDFVSDVKEIDAITIEDPPPRNWVERVWMAIM